ncbi:hypothetical protein BN871_AK_00250 [Paenibacillus sp. P22]|nr:hypothetical protein BN871_AK_00250 [Paenibacillus sp. P22]
MYRATAPCPDSRSRVPDSPCWPGLAPARFACPSAFHPVDALHVLDDIQRLEGVQHFIHRGLAGIMGNHDDLRFLQIRIRLLDNGFEADFVFGEHLRNPGENAGFVRDMEPEEVLGRDLLVGLEPLLVVGNDALLAVDADLQVFHHGHEIRDDRGRRRQLSGARAVEHRFPDSFAVDVHGVEHPVDRGDRMGRLHHRRLHADADRLVPALGDAEQLDLVAEPLRVGDVFLGDGGDALDRHVFQINFRAEAEPGEDRHFAGGIQPFHIGGRVGFGIAEILGLLQHVGVGRPLLAHFRQDVVGRAVDDAHDFGNAVRGKAFVERADDRNAASHAGFVQNVAALLAGLGQNLAAMQRHQILVGRDDMLAARESFENILLRVLDAAHDFYDDIDLRIADDLPRIGRQLRRIDADRPRLLHVLHEHLLNLDRRSDLAAQIRLMALHDPHDSRAHRS